MWTKPQAAKQEPASLSSPENEPSVACFAYLEVLEKTVWCVLLVCVCAQGDVGPPGAEGELGQEGIRVSDCKQGR